MRNYGNSSFILKQTLPSSLHSNTNLFAESWNLVSMLCLDATGNSWLIPIDADATSLFIFIFLFTFASPSHQIFSYLLLKHPASLFIASSIRSMKLPASRSIQSFSSRYFDFLLFIDKEPLYIP